MTQEIWLAIAIGNTHIRAAIFSGAEISLEYTKPHIELDELEYELDRYSFDRILIASVVPDVVTPWHGLAHTQMIPSALVPIKGMYPTFGVDRALTAFGAIVTYGYPILVIDAGTSMTLTGIDATPALAGGAILPGLHAQFRSLRLNAALLPLAKPPEQLPSLWANDTVTSMQSGIVNTVIAGLKRFIIDWQKQFPRTPVIITGGESELLQGYLQGGKLDKRLIFWGMRSL